MTSTTKPDYDEVTQEFLDVLTGLCLAEPTTYDPLEQRYFDKAALAWVRPLLHSRRAVYDMMLDLLAAFLASNDLAGAKKVVYPLTRYLVEELERQGQRITMHDGRALVWGDHSSGRPYEVSYQLMPDMPDTWALSCTCDRYLGEGVFESRPGVCSHMALVAIVASVRGLRGFSAAGEPMDEPTNVLLRRLLMVI